MDHIHMLKIVECCIQGTFLGSWYSKVFQNKCRLLKDDVMSMVRDIELYPKMWIYALDF